ncbi:MAG: cyclic nucleotide-binding domain-containing protein [Kiritimatiellae bacterium]|nr:cyclic nucleotide-binding domain-containing protein [Kiritimatiellia bacterium]
MEEQRIALFQSMPVFGGLTDETLEFLVDRAREVFVHTGDYFAREGEHGCSLFVLEQGRVQIIKAWKGVDYELNRLNPGDCFGEMELIDHGPRCASIRAIEDSTALEVTAVHLHELYRKDLSQFAMIHMNMGREVSRRLRKADDELFRAKVEAALHQPMP